MADGGLFVALIRKDYFDLFFSKMADLASYGEDFHMICSKMH